MTSNELMANPSKTGLLWVNPDNNMENTTIKIGEEVITSSKSFPLLGMKVDDNLNWKTHLDELCNALRQRICILSRLSKFLPGAILKMIAEGIFHSKLRYGISLFSKIRFVHEDPQNMDMKRLQVLQNSMIRVLIRKKKSDRINMEEARKKLGFLSVNQMACYHILTETHNILKYGSDMELCELLTEKNHKKLVTTRASDKDLINIIPNKLDKNFGFAQKSAKLWNMIPVHVRQCKDDNRFKVEAKKFVLTLPH